MRLETLEIKLPREQVALLRRLMWEQGRKDMSELISIGMHDYTIDYCEKYDVDIWND